MFAATGPNKAQASGVEVRKHNRVLHLSKQVMTVFKAAAAAIAIVLRSGGGRPR